MMFETIPLCCAEKKYSQNSTLLGKTEHSQAISTNSFVKKYESVQTGN